MRQQDIERFVRDGLGCQCPPEVFQDIDVSARPGANAAGPHTRLAVGGRLLIHLVDPGTGGSGGNRIAAIARAGRQERDASGYRRFRLVWVTERVDTSQMAKLAASFDAATGGDPMAQLHVLQRCEIPAGLLPVTSPRT